MFNTPDLDKNVSSLWPKISIITPSFNQAKYVRQTIESVLSQRYPNLEYIVVDGGSTDGSVEVIQEYKAQLTVFISEPDNGQSNAINKGFALATGEILTWLNSDDQLAPDALFAVALTFRQKKADLVAGICEVYSEGKLSHRHLTSCSNGNLPLTELLDLDNAWNAGQFFYQPEVFFTKDLWLKAGGKLREDLFYSMDYELWCRFAKADAKIQVIGCPLVHFRAHPEQKTANEAAFKHELRQVRTALIKQFSLNENAITLSRPEVNWSNRLRVAMVNDLGFLYGAGIAHKRIAAAFDLAGHIVKPFKLADSSSGKTHFPDVQQAIKAFKPDIVIFGNLHAVEPASVALVEQMSLNYPCFWLTHDFWLLTGRCAYFESCHAYIEGCNDTCPTQQQYPVIDSKKINFCWMQKKQLLNSSNKLSVLANSEWAHSIFQSVTTLPVNQIRLGVPSNIFQPLARDEIRLGFGIAKDEFCIAFSSSSLGDARKGGSLLLEALSILDNKKLVVLLIGRVDNALKLDGVRVITLGYTDDPGELAKALNAADVYIGPSKEETFGQVFVEAAFCGTPSLGFNQTGMADSIVDGITGYKLNGYNAQSLADGINFLIDNPHKLVNIRFLAPVFARAHFSVEASYHSFFSVLKQLGLVDQFKLPHKTSFGTVSRFYEHYPDEFKPSAFKLLQRAFLQRILSVFPQKTKDAIRRVLPGWLDRKLVKLFFGRNTGA
ncbi:MAG TPA: glycosyltransferase [Rheinheimera sp.]|uniref:glycosyltransferase n=1 Tax=Rheinheimera sp. TaxID=1869214 RepID=UPI002F95FBA5